jgi:hypothetical protein
VLELNFDPNLVLGNHFNLQDESLDISDDEMAMLQQSDYIDTVLEALTEVESDLVDDMLLVNDDESVVVLSAALSDEALETLIAQPDEIDDMLSDVWDEETSSGSKQADKRH